LHDICAALHVAALNKSYFGRFGQTAAMFAIM